MEPTAFVRSVPDSFAAALGMGERPVLDPARARAQHSAYRSLLAASGYQLHLLEADENQPDCPFIEDAAFVLDDFAVATRPGAPERRGEVAPVAAALAAVMPVQRIEAPGTIDGGDVLHLGSVVYVGESSRTNAAAIGQLAQIVAGTGLSVVSVPVSRVLHLKSAVAELDDETLLVDRDCVDVSVFSGYRLLDKAAGEGHRASVLRLRTGALAVTTAAPATTQLLVDGGFAVIEVDSSEFQAADGGLTCLSILIHP